MIVSPTLPDDWSWTKQSGATTVTSPNSWTRRGGQRTRIVGIGDPKQLHSPGLGGHLAAVHHMVGGLELTQNFLQKDALERRALELWDDHGQRPHRALGQAAPPTS
jgi:hypothetical protein